MTLQTLKIGKREFILLARRDFEKLAAQADWQTEDDYWAQAALQAESKSRARKEVPVPFEQIERELNAAKRTRHHMRPRSRNRR